MTPNKENKLIKEPHFIGLPMLEFPDKDDSWREQALCLNAGVDFFNHRQREAQLALCGQCPSKVQCLDFALRNDETDGVWGGLTPDERKVLKRRQISHAA